jgi:hypothetical protein
LSFFDDVEEPRAEAPTVVRRRQSAGSGRRPSGTRRPPGGRRPPDMDQAIRVRRAVAGGVLLVAIILIVVGVHSCQVSQTNSALRDYSDRVNALIQASDQTGSSFFHVLASGQGASNAPNLSSQVAEAHLAASSQLGQAESQSVPDQMSTAQRYLVDALRLRADGIGNIAGDLQAALNSRSSGQAVNMIAAEMARFYASDVLYKDYALPAIINALQADGITVGGSNGEPINEGQFLPSLEWLAPSHIAAVLQVRSSASGGKLAPGLHGHELNSVSVGGTTLQTGSTNNIPATPAPTFTLTFTNTGQNTESNVICKVTVSGTGISGQTTVPSTSPGQQYNCQVQLSSSPPKGSASVTATIEPVPGEKNIANNSLTFPVDFQ